MKSARLGVLALILAWLVGCAGPADRMVIESGDANELGYTYNWVRDMAMPQDQNIGDVRILGDLVVLIEQPGNMVSALAVRDGEMRWGRVVGNLRQPLYGSTLWDEMIHINSPHRLFALDAVTGSLVEAVDLHHTVSTGPVLYDQYAIFGGAKGRVFAHDLSKGFYRWAYQLPDQIRAPATVANGRVFVADVRGNYAMLNAGTGRRIWRGSTFGPIVAPPAIDQDTVYVPCEDRSLYALRAGDGVERWVHYAERPLTRSPSVTDSTVLLPLGPYGLSAIDKREDTVLWSLDRSAELIHQRDDGNLVLHDNRRLILADPETGEVLAEAPTERLATVLAGPNESLILVSERGRILRLNRLR